MPERVRRALERFFSPTLGGYTQLTLGEYEIITEWFGIDYFDIH